MDLENSGPLLTVDGLVRPVITKLNAAECTQYWKEVLSMKKEKGGGERMSMPMRRFKPAKETFHVPFPRAIAGPRGMEDDVGGGGKPTAWTDCASGNKEWRPPGTGKLYGLSQAERRCAAHLQRVSIHSLVDRMRQRRRRAGGGWSVAGGGGSKGAFASGTDVRHQGGLHKRRLRNHLVMQLIRSNKPIPPSSRFTAQDYLAAERSLTWRRARDGMSVATERGRATSRDEIEASGKEGGASPSKSGGYSPSGSTLRGGGQWGDNNVSLGAPEASSRKRKKSCEDRKAVQQPRPRKRQRRQGNNNGKSSQLHPSEARPPKFVIPPFEGDYRKVYKNMWKSFRDKKKLRLGVLCNPPHGAASELPDPKILRDYEVAPTCYRAAESQIADDEFWRQMCERIRRSKDTLSVSDIAAILDALVMVNYRDADLMRIFSREVIDDMFKLTFTEAA
ncbi:hypothetical protein FOZ63_017942, partial [Perkinsus olseni]